jgi:hypothetical protein
MFQLTCIGWVPFRASSMGEAATMLRSIAGGIRPLRAGDVDGALHFAFFAGFALAYQILVHLRGGRTDLRGLPGVARFGIPLVMVYLLLIWGSFGGSPFIYFQF